MAILITNPVRTLTSLRAHWFDWIRNRDAKRSPAIDHEALKRLAETSPHLLEDIGIRASDPRFQPEPADPRPTFGR